MKYISLVLVLITSQVFAEGEYKLNYGINFLPDHPEVQIIGIERSVRDREFLTADLICYEGYDCKPWVGFGTHLIKERAFPFLGNIRWLSYSLKFGIEIKEPDLLVGTWFQFSTKFAVNLGPCSIVARHGSNASALLGQVFGGMQPNIGHNTLGAECRIRF